MQPAIVKIICMRTLSDSDKIPSRSLPEITSRYDGAVSRQQRIVRRKFSSRNRKVSAEAVTNAIVLHFLALSEAEQDAMLDRYLPELAALLGDEAVDAQGGEAPPKVTADLGGLGSVRSRKSS